MDKLLYRPNEAAAAVGISKSVLYGLIRVNRIRSIKDGKFRFITAPTRPSMTRSPGSTDSSTTARTYLLLQKAATNRVQRSRGMTFWLVELRRFELLTSCMPCRPISSAQIAGSLVPALQATSGVRLGLVLAARV
jgi:hypothetical protein